jgi:iron complex outermembrane receptor protein
MKYSGRFGLPHLGGILMTNTSRLRGLLAIGVSGAALLGATSVFAQAPSSPTAPSNPTNAVPNSSPQNASTAIGAPTATGAPAGGGGIAEVVVTAERRQTNLQKVPVAVSVFTAKERDAIGINSVQDVTNFAPGFTYDQGNTHAYIRGVGRQSINLTSENRIAVYEDGLYVYSPYQLDKSSLFLSQEQIERGPQNVGGRNADGGSIDMISVRPTVDPYAEVRASIGNYSTYNLEAAASGEIAPGIQARIAGYDHQQDEGYYKNLDGGPSEGNDIHEWYLEGQLQGKIGDHADWWYRGFVSGWLNRGDAGARTGVQTGSWDETQLTDAGEYAGSALFVNPNYGYAALPGAARTGAAAGLGAAAPLFLPTSVSLINPSVLNNPSTEKNREFAAALPRDNTLKNYFGQQITLNYHFPGADLKYIGGYQQYDYNLNYSTPDSAVSSYTLPGSTVPCGAVVAAFAGTPLSGLNCPTAFPLAGQGALPAASQLVINPLVDLHYQENDRWFSHELNLQSTNDSPFQWQIGGFYYFQHYSNPISTSAPDQPQMSQPYLVPPLASPLAPGGVLAAANPTNTIFFNDYKLSVESEGVYAQGSYKINDDLKITGNIRYSNDEKSGIEYDRDVAFNNTIIEELSPLLGANTPSVDVTTSVICATGNAANCTSGALAKGVVNAASLVTSGRYAGDYQRNLDGTSSAVTGGAGIEYTPNRDTFIYARYSRGYQALTFNAGQIASNPEVGPETIDAYEVGYKQNIGRKISFDADVFYYDYTNLQVPTSVPIGGVIGTEFLNVPDSVTTGFEFEGSWTPIEHLLLTASYSFDYSAFETGCSFTNGAPNAGSKSLCVEDTADPNAVATGAKPVGTAGGVTLQSIKGNPLPEAPRNKVAFNATYTIPFQPGDLSLSASYIWRDTEDGTIFDRKYDNAPSYSQVDLRALWKSSGDKYEVIAYVKNAFDTIGFQAADGVYNGFSGNASQVATPGGALFQGNVFNETPPRTYGLEVRYKFF